MKHWETLRAAVYVFAIVWLNAYICRDWLFHPTASMNSLHGYWAAIARLSEGWWRLSWWPYWDGGMPFEFTSAPLIPMLTSAASAIRGVPPLMGQQTVAAMVACAAPAVLFIVAWRLTRAPEYSFFAALFYSLLSPAQALAPEGPFAWEKVLRPHRLMLQAIWDETPRCAALVFVLLFVLFLVRSIERRRPVYFGAAALSLALALLATPFAIFPAALAVVCLLGARADDELRKSIPVTVAIAALALAIAARFLPPSLWAALAAASATHEPWSFRAVTAFFGTALVWLTVRHFLRRWGADWRVAFVVLAAVAMSCGPVLARWMERQFLPHPTRFRIELEAAAALAVVFALRPLLGRLPRAAVGAIALAALYLTGQQVVLHRRVAKDVLYPADVRKTIEYRTAERVARELPGERVMLPGSIALWANAFTDVHQIGGGEGSTAYSRVEQQAMKAIYEGDADTALAWLKARGASVVVVAGPESREFWKLYLDPGKFDGVLPVLWSEEGITAYCVPGGGLSPIWSGRNKLRVDATTAPGQVVSVPVNWHPGWHASVEGRALEVGRDDQGFMWVRPERPGPVEFEYDGGWELRLCRWLSVVAMVLTGSCFAVGSRTRASGADLGVRPT